MADGLKILVTGATRGLGLAMVKGFIEQGHTICGCGTAQNQIEKLRQQFAAPHRFDQVDVASAGAVAAWSDTILSSWGVPDLLINNAAIINSNARLWEIPAADFDKLFAVNVSGTANIIRSFVPAMVKRRSGVIVNFSSGWGRGVAAEVAPYCASKWAIEGLTQALAEELPANMAAVPLNPGIINTEMLQSCFRSGASAYPDPDQWAQRAVPYILSITSAQNGQPLSVPD